MSYFVAIVLPPVAVLCYGKPLWAACNLGLTLCGWFPGVVHALFIVHNYHAEDRLRRIQKANYFAMARMQEELSDQQNGL